MVTNSFTFFIQNHNYLVFEDLSLTREQVDLDYSEDFTKERNEKISFFL